MSVSNFRFLSASLSLSLALGLAACGAGRPAAGSHGPRPTSTSPASADGGAQVTVAGDLDAARGRLVIDPVADALELVQRGDLKTARAQLEHLVATMPAGWTPVTRTADGVQIAAWSFDEIAPQAIVLAAQPGHHTITWVAPSYSHAYQVLAWIAVEDHDLPRAATLLDRGLALQPHPQLLSERALVAAQQKDLPRALALYVQASESPDATNADQARAWRGRGSVLVDMNQLDQAEQAYRHSLELEADSQLAKDELEYIRQVRAGEIQAHDPDIVKTQSR